MIRRTTIALNTSVTRDVTFTVDSGYAVQGDNSATVTIQVK
jgi:hypothetical protein